MSLIAGKDGRVTRQEASSSWDPCACPSGFLLTSPFAPVTQGSAGPGGQERGSLKGSLENTLGNNNK